MCDSLIMSFSIIHRLDLVEISGKRNRKVPIMLTKETRKAIELLIICRPSTIPSENNYVFACTTRASAQHILGWDCVFENVKEIQACLKQPAAIMGTKLRKYIATVSQTAALTAQDLDWLARHLGHNVSIHRECYRLHEGTTELTKVSKLLLAVDSGNLDKMIGKSLTDMTVEGIKVNISIIIS